MSKPYSSEEKVILKKNKWIILHLNFILKLLIKINEISNFGIKFECDKILSNLKYRKKKNLFILIKLITFNCINLNYFFLTYFLLEFAVKK